MKRVTKPVSKQVSKRVLKPLLSITVLLLFLTPLTGCATSKNGAMTELFNKTNAAGHYTGDLLFKSLPNGRDMEIAQTFEYIDPKNVRWIVPEKAKVNGASIPKALWSTLGGPFSGRYRDASVIHDFHCDIRVRPAKQVHRVFYDAMLTSGVSKTKANVMYYAVSRFGPDWKDVNRRNICQGRYKAETLGLTASEVKICELRPRSIGRRKSKVTTAKFNRQEFEAARKIIEAGSLSPEEIEKMARTRR